MMASFRSLNAIDFSDYFCEFQNVSHKVESNDEDKPDGEEEAEWLEKAGLSHLTAPFLKGKEVSEESLKAAVRRLPSHQAEAVKRRVMTLNATVRQRKRKLKGKGRRDIRDIFVSPSISIPEDKQILSTTPDSLGSLSPQHSTPRDFSTWRQRRDAQNKLNEWESPSEWQSRERDWNVSRKSSSDWPDVSKSDGDWLENSEDEDGTLPGRSSPKSQGYYSNSAASLDLLDDTVEIRPNGKDSPPSYVKIFHAPISSPSDSWRERRRKGVSPRNLPALLKSRAWGTRTIFDAPPGGDVALIDTGVEIIGYQHVGTYYGKGRDFPSIDKIFPTEKTKLTKLNSAGSDSALSADSSNSVSCIPSGEQSVADVIRQRSGSCDEVDGAIKKSQSLALIPRPSLKLKRTNTLSRRFSPDQKLQVAASPTEESGIGSTSSESDTGISPVPFKVKEEVLRAPSFEALSRINETNDELPDVFPEPVESGITRMEDLSEEDFERLHPWVLREVTALFERHGLSFTRRKPFKKKSNEGGSVFGVSLERLLEKDSLLVPSCEIPLILQKILYQLDQRGVKEEGILRVPGHKQKIATLHKEIETHFYPGEIPEIDLNLSRSSQSLYSDRSMDDDLWEDKREKVEKSIQNASCHDLAALLKQVLRELPKPLLTYEYIDAFYLVNELPEIWDQLEAMNLLIILLPKAHRSTLAAILSFMLKVAEFEPVNKMSLQNVAMILAPNLFVPRKKLKISDKDNLSNEVTFAAASCSAAKLLIKYRNVLWTIPPALIKHLRRTFEADQYRKVLKEVNGHHPVRRLLSRGKREAIYRKIVNEVDFQDGILRVNAHQWLVEQYPVKLDVRSTAAGVIMRVVEDFISRPSKEGTLLRRRSDQRQGSNDSNTSATNFSCLLSTANTELTIASHSLFEVGGNIGERRLDPNALMMQVYSDNPNACWVIKCHHPGAK
ncbi:rho GTPase-activating protein 18-like isoform X2 [Artemia franciscana]|uniref:Rho-GAP domain-containing protein n=2 Tax=Artemia franciscana TaxID=6661 RepID=A0AA88HFJ7_ARTSF|nr:hypothetical protein QYM36_016889 [Artemia franciscana]